MAGISNVNIEKVFKNENEDIKKNAIDVYSLNSITRYINYYKNEQTKTLLLTIRYF